MDKYDLINSVIVSLNDLTVSGVRNMKIVLEATAKLAGLRDGLKQSDEQVSKKLSEYEALKESLQQPKDDKQEP